jgi:hypothetical protein
VCACRLVFNGGGKLLWWVGQCKPFHNDTQDSVEVGRTTKCGNPVPPTSSPAFETQGDGREIEKAKLGRKLTPINVTTYGWYYTF